MRAVPGLGPRVHTGGRFEPMRVSTPDRPVSLHSASLAHRGVRVHMWGSIGLFGLWGFLRARAMRLIVQEWPRCKPLRCHGRAAPWIHGIEFFVRGFPK